MPICDSYYIFGINILSSIFIIAKRSSLHRCYISWSLLCGIIKFIALKILSSCCRRLLFRSTRLVDNDVLLAEILLFHPHSGKQFRENFALYERVHRYPLYENYFLPAPHASLIQLRFLCWNIIWVQN